MAYVDVPARANYSVADERNLILAGFLSFSDEPLPDAAQVLASLKQDGVEVKVISGDNDRVTGHVCAQVGIEPGQIITGEDMDRMTDPALAHVAEETRVFARISPAQKNRILLALKHNGHAVGFMGDGINDAPSLHAADVGISVSTAVDVAREAADVILVEPGLRVLHDGIIEGRKAFGNVMKYLADGHEFELWECAQHGRGFPLPAVLADAAHANSAEQSPLRLSPTHHSHGQC